MSNPLVLILKEPSSDRPDWNTIFIDICKVIAQRSTCVRVKTAAIMVNPEHNNIVAIGYNGVATTKEHCCDYWTTEQQSQKEFHKMHHDWSNKNELHAEINCLFNACKSGSDVRNCYMYTLTSPCTNCAKSIISMGIKKVYYETEYDRDMYGIDLLLDNNIDCSHYQSTI